MEEVTIKDICKMFGYNETCLAADMGISISLLSKIQNNQSSISKRTQEKFQKLFPDFKLVNGTYRYKDLYVQALEDLKEADEIINRLETELLVARTKLDAIQNILNKDVK